MWRLPLQCVLISPATAPEKELDARNVHVRWEPQEEGMMRTAASFPSERNQGYRISRSQEAREGCWWRNVVRRNTSETGANVEPSQHNQSTLPQRNSEVVNLTGLL